mmetsp:Transcript_4194/g.5605  ORF Transcript_4194/g.5605 Transcript_4194/m.5605 type:complete len:268 (+) Transcript_4194:185-988(+)
METALVTGANKGIGLAICKKLLSRGEVYVFLGARSSKRGKTAVRELKSQGFDTVEFIKIDVSSESSIEAAVEKVKEKNRKLDILVNNAGVYLDNDTTNSTNLDTTLDVNFFGTEKVTKGFLPLMNKNARIVNVSSRLGSLGTVPSKLRTKFMDKGLTISQLCDLIEQFRQDAKNGNLRKQWGARTSAYGISKLGVSMLSRIYPNEIRQTRPDLIINSCCPGWVGTDMSPSGPLTAEEGARTPFKLCFLPKGSPSGLFWYDESQQQWA